MSRIGKQPIPIPGGVKVAIADGTVKVEGPKGKLEQAIHPNMKVESDGKQLTVARPNDERQNRALHGLTRALINNMVVGVTRGYEKKLKIEGVGFQAAAKGKTDHSDDQWGAFGTLAGVVSIRSGIYFGLQSFAPLWLIHTYGASEATGNVALAGMLFAGAAGTLVGGRLVDRIGAAR